MPGALREILAEFDVEVDDSKLGEVDKKISGVIENVQVLARAFAGGLVVKAFAGFISRSIDMGEEMVGLSRRLGLSTDELQRWQHAARLSEVPTEALTGAIARMQRAAVESADGGSDVAKAFRALGISARDAQGRLKGTDELFTDVGVAIGSLPDPAARTAMAFRLFGRGGAQLLPLFAEGAEGIAKMKAELDELGGGLSGEFIEAADQAGDELTRFDVVMDGFRSMVAVTILPVVSRFVQGLTHLVVWFKKLVEHTNLVKAGFIVLAGILTVLAAQMVAAFAAPLLSILAVVAPIALLVVLVDDLITLFEGGESAIGAFLEGMLGLEGKDQLVEDLKSAWHDLVDVITLAGHGIVDFGSYLSDKWPIIVRDFKEGWAGIRDFVSGAIMAVKAVWDTFVAAVVPALSWIWARLGEVASFIRGGEGSSAQGGRLASDRTNMMDVPAFAGFAAQAGGAGGGSSASIVDPFYMRGPTAPAGGGARNVTIGGATMSLTVQEAFNARETGRVVSAEVQRVIAQQHEEAIAALAPEIPGSGFEDEVLLESGGE